MLAALDIETTGLDRFNDRILCIGVWAPEFSAIFKTAAEFNKFLSENPNIRFIIHNGSFDIGFLRHYGCEQVKDRFAYDTKTIASILCPRPQSLGLEFLYTNLMGGKQYKLDRENLHEKYSQGEIERYCLQDCEITFNLFKLLIKMLLKQSDGNNTSWDFVEKWVMPATRLTADMEYRGILIDKELLAVIAERTEREYLEALEQLEQETSEARQAWVDKQRDDIRMEYDKMLAKQLEKQPKDPVKTKKRYDALAAKKILKIEPFKFSSNKQVAWLLRDYYKLDITRNRDDKESTGEEVLAALAEKDNKIAKALLHFREKEKMLTSCVPAIQENIKQDGRIHPRFNVGGTRTGRLSSSNPNFQQVPKNDLRHTIIASPGNSIVTIDYAQIEVRLMAEASKEYILMDGFKRGLDPYSLLAKTMFDPMDERLAACDVREVKQRFPAYRDCAKTAGLSILYGTGAKKLQATVLKILGVKLSVGKCSEIIENYRAALSQLSDYKAEIEFALANQKIGYNLLGRPLYIESNEQLYMTAFNTMIQGSASDMLVYSAVSLIAPALDKQGIKYNILALVHDEILIELPEDQAERITREIIEPAMTIELQKALGLKVSLKIEYNINKRWVKK